MTKHQPPIERTTTCNVPLTEVESAMTAQILKDKQGTHEACGEIGKAGQIGRIIDKIHNAMRGSLAGRS